MSDHDSCMPMQPLADQHGVLPTGITVDKLPNVKAWLERIAERPAVKKGLEVPSKGSAAKLGANVADPTADPDLKKSYEKALQKVEKARAAL